MKTLGIMFVVISSILLILNIANGIVGTYQYDKNVKSYWELADKSSTIEKKIEKIDLFVKALEEQKFEGKYNAIFLNTPDNSFDANFEALKSLQSRLHQLDSMDITSFAYQTAIQQITAQEQGEAGHMLSVFQGIWWKEHHPLLWDWVCFVQNILLAGFLIAGIIIWVENGY